jgi:hypothetical protein
MKRASIKPGAGFKPRTKPMSRAGKTPATSPGILRVAAVDRERKTKALKTSRPKMTPIRRAARGQDCTLQFPAVCNFDPATTVLCHSNYLADGKGMGLKAPDTAAAFGCAACHDVLDGRRPRPVEMTAENMKTRFYTAVKHTHDVLRSLGLIKSKAPVDCESTSASIKYP